ncbi:MAG TPA: sugar phosphate nucleotidyltransferase [Opitutaceae bacterium]|nr:sugar phosphate nucleotidyltransferase [Opitutaceae bacterium]
MNLRPIVSFGKIAGRMAQNFVVIIAGGKGERFWPQSRAHRPKHLLPIVGTTPLLAQTLSRVRPLAPVKNTFVITSAAQEKGVRACCPQLPPENIVVEPVGRDTAAAVALATLLVEARDPRGVFAVLPADHVIHDRKRYVADLKAAFAAAAADKVLVTLGIPPTEPSTGFGYIERGSKWKAFGRKPLYRVKRFVEKPSADVAGVYVRSGDYVWNAGMFVWSVPTVSSALAQHAPELVKALSPVRAALQGNQALPAVLKKVYPKLPKISVDYALLEKAEQVVMLPSSFDWDDVGAWPAVARHHPADKKGNVSKGRVVVEQGSNNILFSEGDHLVAAIGLENFIVVHTADATLIAPKAKAQEIKALLKQLEKAKDGARWL